MILRVFLLVLNFVMILGNRARLYRRIPQYFVADAVYGFIQDNKLNNCFEFLEDDNQLLLKCWKDNKLTDVEINIINREDKIYYPALSVAI